MSEQNVAQLKEDQKTSLLQLIDDHKQIGLSDRLCSAKTADELRETWEMWETENKDTVERINEWATTYDHLPIFESAQEIKNPIGLAVIIYVIDDGAIDEDDICECWEDLADALRGTPHKLAHAVAEAMIEQPLIDLDADAIFEYYTADSHEGEK